MKILDFFQFSGVVAVFGPIEKKHYAMPVFLVILEDFELPFLFNLC
jgi:hypothetical protein